MALSEAVREQFTSLGLVDPSGNFTSEPNFGGKPEMASGEPDAPPDQGEPNVDREGVQPQVQERPAEVQLPDSGQPHENDPQAPHPGKSTPFNEGDPNSLGNDSDPIRQNYDAQRNQIHQYAQQARLAGRLMADDQGNRVYSDDQVDSMIGQNLQVIEKQLYLDSVMQRMAPVAQRAAAEKFAKQYGVDVAEIVGERSPESMETKARVISEYTRDKRFNARAAAGTDSAEGSRGMSNAIPESINSLSPHGKIMLGLARGDR